MTTNLRTPIPAGPLATCNLTFPGEPACTETPGLADTGIAHSGPPHSLPAAGRRM